MLDIIGQIFWFGAFTTPLFTIPLFYRVKYLSKPARIALGIFAAIMLSLFMGSVGLAICFRNGMGPT